MPNPAKSLINSLHNDAQNRAREAEKRLLYVAQKGAGWKILEFLVQNTAAWGSLWYFLVSFIGVTYSWGFYQQLDIDIFSFFDTSDFLLSAFQNTAMLITVILVTFIGIGILVYSAYNSSVYSSYDLHGDIQGSRDRVRREAITLLSITLVSIILLSIFVLFFSWWNWIATSSNLVLCGIIFVIFILALLAAYRSIKRLASDTSSERLASDTSSKDEQQVRGRREALRLGLLTLAFIAVSFFSWYQLPQILPKALLYLISGGIFVSLVVLTYRFIKLTSNPIRKDDQVLRDERILLFILLIEATFIIPFLWGGVNSYAAREEASRSVKVTISQDRPKTPQPDRTLFLGTTSSFHIFYECAEALTTENGVDAKASWWATLKNRVLGWRDTQKAEGGPSAIVAQKQGNAQEQKNAPKCAKGQPFIIPTANIASLEFIKPKGDLPPHVGLPAVVTVIDNLDAIIKEIRFGEIKVSEALIRINTEIDSINKNTEIQTRFIIPKIVNPKPESIAHLGPDKIATAVVAFQSYLEGKTPATHLNKTITTLNETIKTLNQADVLDPDLVNIATAIKSLKTLKVENSGLDNIPSAIKSLNPLTVVNPNPPTVPSPDLSKVTTAIDKNTKKISKAIDRNTTEISDAIRGLNISCPGGPKPVQGHCLLGWEKVTTIWPFPKEAHELEQNSAGQKKLHQLFTEMEKKFGASTLGQLILVGRSDARPVCKQTLALYGSGNGLAQGRATWVRDELVKKFTTPEQQKALHDRTLLLSAGPLHVRDEASEMNRAKDRSVEVWACWTPKDSE